MFTIDFLKNQGLPAKNRSLEVGMLAGAGVIVLLLVLFFSVQYFQNKTALISKQKALAQCETMLEEVTGEGSLKSQLENKLFIYDQCRYEIAGSIGRYVQWTPVLREFVEALPPSMLLNELSVVRTVNKEKVQSVLDPKKKVDYEIISRVLKSDVHDFRAEAEGVAVESYLNNLRSSQSLKNVLAEAYIFESSDTEYEDSNTRIHKVKNHIINCMLKSQAVAGVQ